MRRTAQERSSATAALRSALALSTTSVGTPSRLRAARQAGRTPSLSWVTTIAVTSSGVSSSALRAGCPWQLSSLRQVEPYMQLAQVDRADEQHHQAVDPGRHAAMRRGPVLEGAVHAAEALLEHALLIAGDAEGLFHHVRAVVADRAGGDLVAVADHVVLERGEPEDALLVAGVERQEGVRLDVRHRERVVREVDLLLLLAPLVHREVGDPAERELVPLADLQLIAETRPRLAGELCRFCLVAGGEEHRVAGLDAALSGDLRLRLGRYELRDRSLAGELAALLLEHNVAEAGGALGAGPLVELVEERARLRGGARRRDRPHDAAGDDDVL